MDYAYFNNSPQAYQLLGLPPTPVQSTSAVSSEDFSNSPPVRAHSFHYMPPTHQASHLQTQDFHQTPSPHYSHSHHSFSHSLSPSPLQYSPVKQASPSLAQTQAFLTPRRQQQDVFDQFQSFDGFPAGQFNTHSANGLPKPSPPHSQQKNTFDGNAHAPQNSYELTDTSMAFMEAQDDAAPRGQSNSDDDDMTPAQSRRKAQNRAAQRAFRERKEQHVKNLEAKLLALESTSKNINEENARLRLQLQKASTENEILKASSSSRRAYRSASPPTTAGPLRYSPTDFYSEVLHAHDNKFPSHRIVVSEGGERLLAAGAAWDYIIQHPLYLRGLVDVGDVSERLKGAAQCDGQGPVFEERTILQAIEMSVASGNDELL